MTIQLTQARPKLPDLWEVAALPPSVEPPDCPQPHNGRPQSAPGPRRAPSAKQLRKRRHVNDLLRRSPWEKELLQEAGELPATPSSSSCRSAADAMAGIATEQQKRCTSSPSHLLVSDQVDLEKLKQEVEYLRVVVVTLKEERDSHLQRLVQMAALEADIDNLRTENSRLERNELLWRGRLVDYVSTAREDFDYRLNAQAKRRRLRRDWMLEGLEGFMQKQRLVEHLGIAFRHWRQVTRCHCSRVDREEILAR
eukprot:TRINITY_DN50348_c0_g1_i2.p1 TRINITY_DN50348_c0_g1~~TRINITY_DN50348_c0_g1_i2.p1  ORF type:complete len:253 (+),score=39.75 TRINITY_DN50348_c0_g1_i2:78-836(+)